jgi:hypothetical protein
MIQQSQDCSPWKDLTKTHKKIREELEKAILGYVKNQPSQLSDRYLVPIIVAPYGSGKTTLLSHLLCFALKNGIPAVKVNLSSLVNYLKELKGGGSSKIPSDQLPGYASKFCVHIINKVIKSNDAEEWGEFEHCCINREEVVKVLKRYIEEHSKCVLLIDEIEDHYKELRNLISYDTTPFRGLFDRVCEGKSWVFPILAFGPSSIYAETVSTAGSWRTRIYPISLVYPLELSEKLSEVIKDGVLRKYLANLIWWMGKGRMGHVYKLINMYNSINSDVIASVINSSNPKISLSKLFTPLEGIVIVGNVTYVDLNALDELLDKVTDPLHRKLFSALIILIGQVPESLLKSFLTDDELSRLKIQKLNEDFFVKSRKIIKVDDLHSAIKRAIKDLGKDIDSHTEDTLNDILRIIIQAWSDHEYVVLNEESLKDLFEIIKGMSIEFYKPEIYDVFNSLDPNAVYSNYVAQSLIEDVEYHYALRPSVIERVYPPIILMPIIGCSRSIQVNNLANSLYQEFSNYNEQYILGISEKLMNHIKYKILKVDSSSDATKNLMIVFVPSTHVDNDKLKTIILQNLLTKEGVRGVILIPIPLNEGADNVINRLRERWRHFMDAGIVHVLYLGDKATLFLISMLYNMLNRCFELDRLDRNERNLVSQYAGTIYRITDEYARKVRALNVNRYIKVNDRIEEALRYLVDEDHSIGEANARYIWLIESSKNSEELWDYLKKFAEQLNSLNDDFEKIFGENSVAYKLLGKKVDSVLSNASLINSLLKNSKYFDSLRTVWTDINKVINDPNNRSFKETLKDLISIASMNIQGDKGKGIDLRTLINKVYNKIDTIVNMDHEVLRYMLTWHTLQEIENEIPEYMESVMEETCNIVTTLNNVTNVLGRMRGKLKELRDKINRYINNGEAVQVGFINNIDELMKGLENFRNKLMKLNNDIFNGASFFNGASCEDLKENLEEFIPYLQNKGYYEKLLILEFMINKLIGSVINNINNALMGKDTEKGVFNIAMNNVDELIRKLNEIDEKINKLKKYSNDSKAIETIHEDIAISLRESAGFSDFSSKLEDLSKDIDYLIEVLSKNQEVINKLGKLRSEIENLRRTIGGWT